MRTYSRTYSYDKLGNVQKVIQGGTNGFTRDFRYNANVNTLEKVVDGSAILIENFTYDANGNQLSAGTTRNYKWNHSDQLICYYNQAGGGNPTVFTQYDYAGQNRVSKLIKTGTIFERTIYIDGIFEYVKLFNRGLFEKNYIHIMDDKSRIAEVRVNGATLFQGDLGEDVTYILENQIGSSVMRLKSSGIEIDREEYYPFGDSSLRTFTYKRYRYVGKERDSESGLYYYGARYYAAWTCRFISVDPLAEKYAHLSSYNYASNNPIGQIDVDGMQNPAETPSEGSKPPDNPYSGDGIQTRTTPKPQGRWGRIACDACELDVLRNNPNAMNIGTEGKIFYAPGVDVTGRMIWVKPQVTTNVNTVVATTPTGPGIIGAAMAAPVALQVPVNFNSGTNVLAPTGGAAINNAVAALNVQGGVFQPVGNPITNVGPVGPMIPAPNLLSESSTQVTTVNQPGQIVGQTTMFTLDLSTGRQQTPQATALLNARYNTIRGQMIAAGVPAANISMGTLRYGQTAAQMGGNPNNSTTFRAQQFPVVTPAVQNTTTTTTTVTNNYN